VEGAVYLLCAATALACALLLLRGYRRTRVRLLLWCGLFFLAMVAENALLFIDVVIVPERNLSAALYSVALAGVALLLYGLIFDAR
jgi:hypothetical protein